jgi:hypothetical protein
MLAGYYPFDANTLEEYERKKKEIECDYPEWISEAGKKRLLHLAI